MSATQRFTGKNLVVQWHYLGGTHVLSGDQTTLDMTWTMQSADVSAATDGGVYEIPTLEDITYSLNAFYIGTAGTAVWSKVKLGNEGTLVFGVEGTAAGKPKWGSLAFVQEQSLPSTFNEGVSRTVNFRGQGTMIFRGDEAVWP